jgi:Na+-driven multidrug efflux pump
MLAIGVPGLRLIAATFALATATSLLGSAGAALGNAVINLCASLMRQVVILVPAAWLLLRRCGIGRMWYAFWLAEAAALLFSAGCMYREFKKKVEPIL